MYPNTRASSRRVPATAPVERSLFTCDICKRCSGTQRGLDVHRRRSGHKAKEKPSVSDESGGDTVEAAETGRKVSPETDGGDDAQALDIPDGGYNEGSRVGGGCAETQTEGE
ncbi:hypothetical protein MRX96_025732 [Rhipicephalus microplus]